jgi:hypothetical protein
VAFSSSFVQTTHMLKNPSTLLSKLICPVFYPNSSISQLKPVGFKHLEWMCEHNYSQNIITIEPTLLRTPTENTVMLSAFSKSASSTALPASCGLPLVTKMANFKAPERAMLKICLRASRKAPDMFLGKSLLLSGPNFLTHVLWNVNKSDEMSLVR